MVLIGAPGSGKTTFAARHFLPTQVLSNDTFRGMVSDDENDQSATKNACEVLRFISGKWLAAGRITIEETTSIDEHGRTELIRLAREHNVLSVAIVLDPPEAVCVRQDAQRPERGSGIEVIRKHCSDPRRSLQTLHQEGCRQVHVLRGEPETDTAPIHLEKLHSDKQDQHRPFDVIGDVHGPRRTGGAAGESSTTRSGGTSTAARSTPPIRKDAERSC